MHCAIITVKLLVKIRYCTVWAYRMGMRVSPGTKTKDDNSREDWEVVLYIDTF